MTQVSQRLKQVITDEYSALRQLERQVGQQYDSVVETLLHCRGKVVFMGIGKSGHIGEKLAATFSSTGTPSFFVHSAEAAHGDLGMIGAHDIVILISNSGNTKEVIQNIPLLKKIGCKTIAFTSNGDSALAHGCDSVILYPHRREADDLNLAPTVSSTLALVLGDAIACTLSTLRGFSRADFFRYHPGGALGEALREEAAPCPE